MKCLLSIILFIFSAIFLSSCSPIYKTEYAYVPPRSDVARVCTANCIMQKNTCQQMCEMKIENCRLREKLEDYRIEKEGDDSFSKALRTLDKALGGCNESCNCEGAYNDCYTECGGEVFERKICVAFCDQIKKKV